MNDISLPQPSMVDSSCTEKKNNVTDVRVHAGKPSSHTQVASWEEVSLVD